MGGGTPGKGIRHHILRVKCLRKNLLFLGEAVAAAYCESIGPSLSCDAMLIRPPRKRMVLRYLPASVQIPDKPISTAKDFFSPRTLNASIMAGVW
jgi:hypothetical protein